jgi:hypothetical protein
MHRVRVVPRIIRSVVLSFRCDGRCLPTPIFTEHMTCMTAGVRHNYERDFSWDADDTPVRQESRIYHVCRDCESRARVTTCSLGPSRNHQNTINCAKNTACSRTSGHFTHSLASIGNRTMTALIHNRNTTQNRFIQRENDR